MDLKKKFSQLRWSIPKPSFLNSNVGLSPDEEPDIFPDKIIHYPSSAAAKAVKNRSLAVGNPHKEQEVLDSIESCFYSHGTFDPSAHELNKLPDVLDVNDINDKRKVIKEQLSVVSKKISDLILENHPSYAAELQKVTELQKLLLQAYDVCYRARSQLQESQEDTTAVGLRILAYNRKINLYRNILSGLRTIKTLHETDFRLRELLEEGNYSGAIQLCLECQKAAEVYRHYSCIGELNCKLHDTLTEMEEQLDRALASIALTFDLDRYRRLHAAYALLNKENESVDKLLGHFGSAVTTSPLSVLSVFVDREASFFDSVEKLPEICKAIPVARFIDCFTEILRLLWKILHNYHCVLIYHTNEAQVLQSAVSDDDVGARREEIREKFHLGLVSIWDSAVNVIDTLLANADLNSLKFDAFLEIVSLANTFTEIGKRNFLSTSFVVQETVKKRTASYFKCYHRARLEELKMFLESEAWEICPVSKSFRIYDLPEFSFLKPGLRNGEVHYRNEEQAESGENRVFELMDINEDNPFAEPCTSQAIMENVESEAVESDDSEVAEELKRDFVEEGVAQNRPEKKHSGYKNVDKMPPILCNTALNVLRLFGRYLHIVTILKSIGFEVTSCLAQFFDYYFYTVWRFFASDAAEFNLTLTLPKLQSSMKRIEQSLIDTSAVINKNERVAAASLSPVIDLNNPESLFALSYRIVGVESLIYVARQVHHLHDHLQAIVPKEKRTFLQQFSQTLSLCSMVRRPVYGAVAARCLNYSQLLNRINAVTWDISELMSQHNSYVDFLVQELNNFQSQLNRVAKNSPLPREAYEVLWDVCIRYINRILVEGYANARKCTNEGRALMQLDFQQLIRELESLTELRPIPDKNYVETYIKGYYLPESSIDAWISEHKEYSVRQVLTLLNVATHISKKTRQRIITSLEEPGTAFS